MKFLLEKLLLLALRHPLEQIEDLLLLVSELRLQDYVILTVFTLSLSLSDNCSKLSDET